MLKEQLWSATPDPTNAENPAHDTIDSTIYTQLQRSPFRGITWDTWLAWQGRAMRSLIGFQHAAECRVPQGLFLHILTMHELAYALYEEACLWVTPSSQEPTDSDQLVHLLDGLIIPTEHLPKQPTPFRSLSWHAWQHCQAQLLSCLSGCQSAAEHHLAQSIINHALDLQALVLELQYEASLWTQPS